MNRRLAFRPDLDDCMLEARLTPIIPNLGLIALTTGGYMLLIPFPGAFISPSGASLAPGPSSASGVSGTPINAPFFMLGSGGISSVIPGNITGVPSLGAGGPASALGVNVSIQVGSGADEDTTVTVPPVTRNTVGNSLVSPPLIGGMTPVTSALPPLAPTRAITAPAGPAAAAAPPTGAASGPTMPPPGSSLNGPFVRFPSMLPRSAPLGFPAGSPIGAAPSSLPAINPPPAPGSVPDGSAASSSGVQ